MNERQRANHWTSRPHAPLGAETGHLRVKGVSRFFKNGTVHALDRVSLDIAPGEFVSLVGPSGCGKTTLLRLLDGLIVPDEGEVLLDGVHPKPSPEIGFVFQQPRLLPWLSVQRNVEFPLTIHGVGRAERTERAKAMLAMVGLTTFAGAFPGELSGGMQQRVGIARAFVGEPSLLLMDEPFAALDAMTREIMRSELLKVWSTKRTAVVFVTHDIDEAVYLSQRIVMLRPRPGRVDEIIEVDLPEPRWVGDVTATPQFRALREHIWTRIQTMVGASSDWHDPTPDDPTSNGSARSGQMQKEVR